MCPACGVSADHEVAVSLNGERSPEWRATIVQETFQLVTCRACTRRFIIDDPFMYVDFARKHWIGVYPRAWISHRDRLEAQPGAAFASEMQGPHTPAVLREVAAGFRIRAVFGLAALAEKLRCFDDGLDDAALALYQLAIMRANRLPLLPEEVPRYMGLDGEALVFRLRGDGPRGGRLVRAGSRALLQLLAHEGPTAARHAALAARADIDAARLAAEAR